MSSRAGVLFAGMLDALSIPNQRARPMPNPLKNLTLLLLGLVGFHPGLAMAQTNDAGVLCIDDIEGESERPTDVGCVDVLAWSWGQSSSVSGVPPSGGIPSVQDFSFTKSVDTASEDFFRLLVTGTSMKGVVRYRQYADCGTSCQATEPYLSINFRDVAVSSNSIGGSSGGEPAENVSLYFVDVSYCYRPTVNGALGAAQCFAFSRDGDVSIPPF